MSDSEPRAMAANVGAEIAENVEAEIAENAGCEVRGYFARMIFQQMELMTDEPEDTREIQREKKLARFTLRYWEEDIQRAKEETDQMRAMIDGATNEVYQLVSLYSVFAGVVLTAVTTSSRLECQHLWIPTVLCLFAFVMIIGIARQKFLTIQSLLQKKYLRWQDQKVLKNLVHKLKAEGYQRFNFSIWDREIRSPSYPHEGWKRPLILICFLAIFTVVLVGSFVHILCRTKSLRCDECM